MYNSEKKETVFDIEKAHLEAILASLNGPWEPLARISAFRFFYETSYLYHFIQCCLNRKYN